MDDSLGAPRRRRLLLSTCALALLAMGGGSGGAAAQDGAGSLALDTIDVRAEGGATEGTGSYSGADITPSATGLPLTPRELPQSVSITTQQEIVDQNFQTLNDAIDFVPGLTAQQGNGEMRWLYYARGSEIVNLQYDGVPSYVHFYARDAVPQDDLAMYDRVEVIRGATGLLEGTGNPSASINLVRKRALSFGQVIGEAGATSYGSGHLMLDASSPLNAAGTVRGRLVADGTFGEGERDNLTENRGLLYGAVDFDLGERTTASLGAAYVREDIDGYSWGGIWTRPDGTFFDFDGHTSPSLDWEYSHREGTTGFAEVVHELGNGWTLRGAGRALDGDTDMFTSYMRWDVGDDGPVLLRDGGRFRYVNQNYSLDLRASGPVTLFGRTHDLVFGVNGFRDRTRYDGGSYYLFEIADPAVADPHAEPKPPFGPYLNFWDMTSRQVGAYGAARLSLTDRLKLIAGGRVTWFDYHEDGDFAGPASYSVDGEVLPYLGAIYDIDETWTVYASYAEIFQPQQTYGTDGLLPPVTGANLEAGVKASFLDGSLLASAAIFRTDRGGMAEVDPSSFDCGPPVDPTCYQASGTVRTQGIELEVSGALSERWNLFVSYTYANSETIEGENEGERFEPNYNPKVIAKLGTTYELGGALSDLTVGGAIRYQSETYADGPDGDWASAGVPFRIEQPAYAVVDLMARYALTERTTLQLNVDNLFDETYYSAISNPGYGNFIGAPLSASLTLRHTF
jgi:outer membrane receptor for ferric coprogen and ferric-rhodotorulic acid